MKTAWYGKKGWYRLLVGLGWLLGVLFLTSPSFANDLQIEEYSFDIKKNGIVVAGDQLGYLNDSDNISADFELATSWGCQVIYPNFICLPPPNFNVLLQVVAIPEICKTTLCLDIVTKKFDLAPVTVNGATEVRDRPHPFWATPLNTTAIKNFNLQISQETDFNVFVSEWYDQDYYFALRVKINYDSTVAETDAGGEYNNGAQSNTTDFIPLTKNLDFGPTPTLLTALDGVSENSLTCGSSSGDGGTLANLQLLNGSTQWIPSPGAHWNNLDVSLSPPPFCAEFHRNADGTGFNLTALTTVSTDTVVGQLGDFPVTVHGNTLDHVTGASPGYFSVALPNLTSYHQQDPFEPGPTARGEGNMVVTSINLADPNDYDTLSGDKAGGYLHREGLPFSIEVDNVSISSSEFTGSYSGANYVHDRGYSGGDNRQLSSLGPISNDRRFSFPGPGSTQPETAFLLTSSGLHIPNIDFMAMEVGRTHFPRTTAHALKDFGVGVSRGLLNETEIQAADKYSMTLSTDCAGCDGGGGGPAYELNPVISEGLASDGAVITRVENLSDPYWGPSVIVFDQVILPSQPSLVYQLTSEFSYDLANNGASNKLTNIYAAANYSFKPIFEREGDTGKNGILYLPGTIAQGTGGANALKVSNYLLGMRYASDSGGYLTPDHHFSLPSNTSRRGNYFMAGLTVGPELYSRPADKQPEIGEGESLDDTDMTIGFGGKPSPDFKIVGSSVGTKYVVRPGGVTGAFNFDTVPQPKVYGYSLGLTRFAFRQINNIPDDFTWMDGDISIPGRGGFDVVFESLELECSGDVGKGLVSREARPGEPFCIDGIDNNNNTFADENCAESFNTWNAAIDLLSMEFVAKDPNLPVCESQDRDLLVGNTVNLKALNEPLGMLAKWKPDGDPFDASVNGNTDQVMDQPKVGGVPDAGKPGFNVALDKGIVLKWPTGQITNGWFAMDSEIGVPFWNSLDTSNRVANKQGNQETQDQTIIIAKGTNITGSSSGDDSKSNGELKTTITMSARDGSYSWDSSASYEWGSTGFGFSVPIFYEMNRHSDDKQPRFLGRTVSKDLVVLDANAGADWVSPDNTKVSFGASADFQRLAGAAIDINVDLSDPESVADLDSFLNTLGVSGNPVADLINGIKSKLSLMNLVADAGLDDFLELGVDAALSSTPMSTAFSSVATTLGKVQSIPEQLASEVEDGLKDLTSEIINPLSATLDGAMLNVYDTLPGLYLDAASGSPDVAALDAYLALFTQAATVMGQVKTALESVDAEVSAAKSNITTLTDKVISGPNSYVQKTNDALTDLKNVLTTAGDLTSCSFGTSPINPGTNDMLGKVGEVLQRVDEVRDALETIRQASQLVNFGSQVASVAGIDLSSLNNAQQAVNALIEEIKTPIDQAFNHLNGLCGSVGAQLSNSLNSATALINNLSSAISQIGGISGKMVQARDQLLTGLDTVSSLSVTGANKLSVIVDFLDKQQQVVENAKNSFPDGFPYDGLTLVSEIQTQVFDASLGTSYQWYYATPSPHTFVEELKNNLRNPIDTAIATAVAASSSQLQNLVSLVPHPTKAELRNQIKDLIMNSQAVESIDNMVNLALGDVFSGLNDVGLDIFDQLNLVIKDIIQQLEDKANEALQLATSEIANDIPVGAAKLDGYAIISGDELERLHIGAEWTMSGDADDNSTGYAAALDVTSWSTNNKGLNCLGDADITGLLDAMISIYGVPISIGVSDATIEELYLGFTLENLGPVGIFGGISIDGDLDFQAFILYDIAFAAGVGKYENYLGASAGGLFDDIQVKVAFLVGKTCNTDVLLSLDPQAAEFITFPGGIFNGVYARGSASFPVWSNGCFLTVGVSADVGAWVLIGPPFTIGGLVGGGAFGKAICVASLRGQVMVWAQKVGDPLSIDIDGLSFGGEGFGGAGIGFCEPSGWTSVSRIRDDDWCGTGDASFGAKYDNGWDLYNIDTSAID